MHTEKRIVTRRYGMYPFETDRPSMCLHEAIFRLGGIQTKDDVKDDMMMMTKCDCIVLFLFY